MRPSWRGGARWLAATIAFVAALSLAVTATRSRSPRPGPGGGTAKVTGPAFACPKPRGGIWIGAKTHGRKVVALSFDDGPSAATPAVLKALRRHRAHATFFVVGNQVPGREETLREAVRDGNELGNHSTSHTPLPGRGDIARTSRLIERVTGRPPCLFRPPDGATTPGLLHDVHGLGMTTIGWDVDTADWQDQTPADIRERALATVHPGSIVLLHDGGGDRRGTAAAVSAIVSSLQARGYRVVTVSELFARPDPGRG